MQTDYVRRLRLSMARLFLIISPVEPFRSYRSYLLGKYGCSAYRVAVDAGFSCPNRGEDRANPGCIYCDEYGSRAVYSRNDPYGAFPDLYRGKESARPASGELDGPDLQIDKAVRFLRKRYRAVKLLLYFQAFSGTNAPVLRLKRLYDACLKRADFSELIVSTRPDCLDEEKAALLASYRRDDFDVWAELGLQSANEYTLRRIKRGHTCAQFEEAFTHLRRFGIKCSVHLIFGLPGEGWKEIEKSVRYTASLGPDAVKIHNLHVALNTELAGDFLTGELAVPCEARHFEYVVRALELLPPSTIIQRLVCDTPRSRLVAPRPIWQKTDFHDKVGKELKRRDTCQGRRYLEEKERNDVSSGP